MKVLLIIALTASLLTACRQKQTPPQRAEQAEQAQQQTDTAVITQLPPLVAEEVFYKGKEPFGELIQLTGKQVVADTAIFKIRETESVIKNGKLFIKTARNLLLFNLSDLKFEGFHGLWGNGSDEFLFPHIVPAMEDSTLLCYLIESTNSKLYEVDMEGKITRSPFSLSKSKLMFNPMRPVNIAKNDFLYVTDSPTGKSIYRTTLDGDSISVREVFNLALNPKRKSPFAYIGDFAVNPRKDRMVYAYKYFKILKFMDLEAKTVKTINFEREEFDESTNHDDPIFIYEIKN
jgi:hypothetical protein